MLESRTIEMAAQLDKNSYTVSAHCPNCGVVTSFGQITVKNVDGAHTHNGKSYTRVLYVFSACARCGRGALSVVSDNGNAQSAVLESFFPISIDAASLPKAVPVEIEAEFREAENCAASGFRRAASALFRSVLEKALKANGYVKGNDPSLTDLQKRIDAAGRMALLLMRAEKERTTKFVLLETTCFTTIGELSMRQR
jgi:hypothetical protein